MEKTQKRENSILVTILIMTVFISFSGCTKRNLDDELVKAAKLGKCETIKKLLAQGAGANSKDIKHQSSALMWAAHEGHICAIEILIENAVNEK